MTKRADIQSGRLIDTEHLGWIDKGHAKGDDTRALWAQLLSEEPNPLIKGYFLVNYSQAMGTKHIRTSVHSQWKMKKRLSIATKHAIALSMMFCVSQQFEGMQSSSFYSSFTNNVFSCEDWVSNLLGFYSVILARNYLLMIKPKSKEYAFKIWNYFGSIGKYKNNQLRVFLFPDSEESPSNTYPIKEAFPLTCLPLSHFFRMRTM
ncbi:hypothetical protein ACQ86O_20350 [Serratia sp. L9]|uniref:hypothetical protein n=1 Tax=Serratia sp. L9 TaxID=3423946 RepID=UPI003D66880A